MTSDEQFQKELLGGLRSAISIVGEKHGDHAAMVVMRLEQAITHLTALSERCAALEEDGKRLDWLEEKRGAISRDNFGAAHVGHGQMLHWKTGPTLRHAIDAARSSVAATGHKEAR